MMASCQDICFCLALFSLLFVPVRLESQGVFEIRLKRFSSINSLHDCKSCLTNFDVCLKHYESHVEPGSACTFGHSKIEVDVGFNSNVDRTVRFPIDFKWPGTFSLILEARRDPSTPIAPRPGYKGIGDPDVSLLLRVLLQRELSASPAWTSAEYVDESGSLSYAYRMLCSKHYYGSRCERLCRPRDDRFGHYTCDKEGNKICLNGWTKDPDNDAFDYCTKPVCAPGCLEGTCTVPGECRCKSGWIGAQCDQCQRYPGCQHGSCSKPFECNCDSGWGGLFCNEDLNYCTNHKPCANGATCQNTGPGLYTCLCAKGFVGRRCEQRLSKKDCSTQPCFNGGTCISDASQGYICKCPLNFRGQHCELNLDVCQAANPCRNGGKCRIDNRNNDYTCTCPPGFRGRNCEENIDDCRHRPCQNGATCLDFVQDYKCYCKMGFVGRHCEINVDDCSHNPCANGGTCHDSIDDFVCTCPPGFGGKACAQELDECANSPCLHDGVCVDLVNDFECKCRPGFKGKHCQIMPNGVVVPLKSRNNESNEESSNWLNNALWAIIMPLLAIVAIVFVWCTKRRHKLEQRFANEEARRENELNAITCVNKVSCGKKMMINNESMIVNVLDFPDNKSCNGQQQGLLYDNPSRMRDQSKRVNSSILTEKLLRQSQERSLEQRYCNVVECTDASASSAASTVSTASSSDHGSSCAAKSADLPTASSIMREASMTRSSPRSKSLHSKSSQPDFFATEV